MHRSLITLTTDFGLADHYVAAMKGVILSIHPQAEIIDVSHQISPYSIEEAAFVIAQTYPYYPRRTVHVAVIDPGVGTERRPILVQAAGQYFIGPDNGVFGLVCRRERHKFRLLENRKYFREEVSSTFHGRDIFAPSAAHLSRGVRPSKLGPIIGDYLMPMFAEPRRTGKKTWRGNVLKVDHFGNLITNFPSIEFAGPEDPPFRLRLGKRTVRELATTFAECGKGELSVLPGSSGYLEVVTRQDSAARLIGCAPGDRVSLTLL